MSTPLPTPTVRKFSASAAKQLMQCPGSARLEEAIPGFVHPVRDDTKGMKATGTTGHGVIEALAHVPANDMMGYIQPFLEWKKLQWRKRRELIDDFAVFDAWIDELQDAGIIDYFDGTTVTPDLVWNWLQPLRTWPPKLLNWLGLCFERVEWYATEVDGLPNSRMWSEVPVKATWLEGLYTTTPDLVAYESLSKTLTVVDFKAGAIPVDAIDNDQLLYYAACYYHTLHPIADVTSVRMEIIQPGNTSEHSITIDELETWIKKAVAAEEEILKGSLKLVPGDGCTFCPANPHTRGDKGAPLCPAMMEVLYPVKIDPYDYLNI